MKYTKQYFLLVLIGLFLSLSISAWAQTPTWQWAQAGIANQGTIIQNGIGKDATGNIYVTGYGYTAGGMVFGNLTLPPMGMFLAKYNSQGKLVWAKQQLTCMPRALYTDAAGNCYVTGMYRDTLRVGNNTLKCEGFSDIFVMKYDSTGNLAWVKRAGGPGRHPQFPPPILYEDEGTTIAADTAGNVYVGGYYFARANTTTVFDTIIFTVPSNVDQEFGFLAKYNAAGRIQWVQNINFSGTTHSLNIAVSKKGNCYLTGSFKANLIFNAATPALTSINGGDDIYIARYNTNGNLQWAKSFGGADSEYGEAIAVNKQNECYLTGSFSSANLPIGNYSLTGSANRGTIYVAKCDSSGNILWATQTTGSGSIGDSDMDVDTAGNAYLASWFSGTVTIGQQAITASSGSGSLAVSKWSSSGLPLWAVAVQGSGGSFKITAGSATDECYVAGDFMGGISFGNHSLYSQNYGVFLAKLSSLPTGIIEMANDELSVYPNPAQQYLYLNLPEMKGKFEIRLTDLQGKTVLFREVKAASETKLELPELATGVYILQAQTGKRVFRKKVVIP